MNVESFFDDLVVGPPRDRHGQPLLIPAGGEVREAYTRASSLADIVSNFSHLHKWQMRYLAQGIGRRRDYAMLAAVETYSTGLDFDRSDKEAVRANRASAARLDEVIARALDYMGISARADQGTAVHAATEPGAPVDALQEDMQANVDAWWNLVRDYGIRLLGTEMFVANDRLRAAGTFDHLAYVPGFGICVIDKKTSATELHSDDFRVQLSVYAYGELYDWRNDTRQTLEEYVDSLGLPPEINRRDGILVWIRNGKATLERVDLEVGYRTAKGCAWIRDNHVRGGVKHTNVDGVVRAAHVEEMEAS